uniref:SCP domain-containing protein n=1 Tax=Mesocestoides corti TaxID=53468 RepID=A0A5K3FX61_MESCO
MLKLLCLLILTWHVLAEVPTDVERKTIVECHTKLREHVNPPASNMMLLNYSIEMENLAVKYIADCRRPANVEPFEGTSDLVIDKLPGKSQYVEELCKVNGNHYNFERNDCNGPCIAYNQVVWAASTQFGCAIKNCPIEGGISKSSYTSVCIYKPGDELVARRPYESGKSCSQCPDGYGCQRNQCYRDTPTTTTTSIAMTTTSIGTPTTNSIAMTTTSIGTVFSTIEKLIFATLLLHCLE